MLAWVSGRYPVIFRLRIGVTSLYNSNNRCYQILALLQPPVLLLYAHSAKFFFLYILLNQSAHVLGCDHGQNFLSSTAFALKMTEKLTKNGRYLVNALVFCCLATSLYGLLSLSFVRQRLRLSRKVSLPQDSYSSLPGEFPLKIWQTSKSGVIPQDQETQWHIQTWIEQNPNHRYEMATDGSCQIYVRDTFAHKPEIVHHFLALQDPVMRADFLRYLFLYGSGGIYSDLDTICLRPFDTWIPAGFKNKTNLIIGIEGDSLGGPMIPGFSHHVGLGQWTLAAKPGHVMLERMIESVLSGLTMLAERQNRTLADFEASYQDVIDTTGPGAFSKCVYHELSLATGSNFTSSNLTGLTEARLIGDVLILPVTAFANGVPHSNAKGPEDEGALVQHLFHGSWKGTHVFESVEAEPENVDAQPENFETQPENVGTQPEDFETQPENVEIQSENVEVGPENFEAESENVTNVEPEHRFSGSSIHQAANFTRS